MGMRGSALFLGLLLLEKRSGSPIAASIPHLGIGLQLPLVLPFLHHLIDRLLANLHGLSPSRHPATCRRLKNRFSAPP